MHGDHQDDCAIFLSGTAG